MARLSWKFYIGLILIGTSVLLFFLHFLIFRDIKTLSFYLALDIVFVPIQVLLVTIIIERLLGEREKQALMKKLNMVIGAFSSEVGMDLLKRINAFCDDMPEMQKHLSIDTKWGAKEFKGAMTYAAGLNYSLSPTSDQLTQLRDFLKQRRSFVLGLLQNPNLLEHEAFTDLLWAVTHLTEELEMRDRLDGLPRPDVEHLKGDTRRAYGLLIREWLAYMLHLKIEYPYIYSLGMRSNPFNPDSEVIIKEGS